MKTLYILLIVGITILVIIGFYLLVSPSASLTDYSPTCISSPNSSQEKISLKQFTWISVIEIQKNQTKLDCTELNRETFLTKSKLVQALDGADQCMQGKDECTFPSGMGLVMLPLDSPAVMPIEDKNNYQLSLTREETESLLDNVRIASIGNLTVGDIKYNDRYYQVILWTRDEPSSPQVSADYAPEPIATYDLAKGKSVNYIISVKTLATFGLPAKVQLYSVIPAQDSGLDAKIIPDTLYISERSQTNATQVITAGSNAQDGIYEIGFEGKIPNGGFSGGMRQSNCPCIRIGNSDWTIRNYENYGGWGGNQAPSWLKVETVTDKQDYHAGETIQVKNYIINDSPNRIILNDTRLFLNVYNQVNDTGTFRYFYGIDAYDHKSLVLEPHSKTIIARPFYWDQSDLRTGSIIQKVIPGHYRIDASFGSYNGTVWDNDVLVTIK